MVEFHVLKQLQCMVCRAYKSPNKALICHPPKVRELQVFLLISLITRKPKLQDAFNHNYRFHAFSSDVHSPNIFISKPCTVVVGYWNWSQWVVIHQKTKGTKLNLIRDFGDLTGGMVFWISHLIQGHHVSVAEAIEWRGVMEIVSYHAQLQPHSENKQWVGHPR